MEIIKEPVKYNNYKKLTLDLIDYTLNSFRKDISCLLIADYEKNYPKHVIKELSKAYDIKIVFTNEVDIYYIMDELPAGFGLVLVRVFEHLDIYSRSFKELVQKCNVLVGATPNMEKTLRDIILNKLEKEITSLGTITYRYLRATYEIINEYQGWYRDAHKWFVTRKAIETLPHWKENKIIDEVLLDGFPHLVTVHTKPNEYEIPTSTYQRSRFDLANIPRTKDIDSYLFEEWYNVVSKDIDTFLLVFPDHESLIEITDKSVFDKEYIETVMTLFNESVTYFATPDSIKVWLTQEGYFEIEELTTKNNYIYTKLKAIK